jgi:polysaccharide chain length determinant protein (PEP-CTERM system associated)
MEDTHVHALDYLTVFRRRKWWLAVPVVGSVAIGALLVVVLPKEFRATATIGVEAPAVSPYIVNQSALDNQERLRALQQQLMSAPILARVAREEGLSGSADAGVIQWLRSGIQLLVPDPVAATSEPRRLDTFLVSYSDRSALRAQQIANRIASVFVEENSKVRTEHAENTSEFIATQQRVSQERLDALEAQLRGAKEAHMGQLPEQTPANLQTLSGLRQQIEANATSLRGEQDRLSMIERQMDGMAQGNAGLPLVARSGADAATLQPPETRVMVIERELAEARMTYTDKHPEVLRLQDELKSARADVAAERQRPTSDRIAQLQLDPAYRQLAADREMTRLRVRDLERTETDLRRQIATYQARVESAPVVEQKLVSIQRDYDLERQQYADLATKLHTAAIAESVERNKRGEKFTVLETAAFPTTPIKPVGWRVMLISIAAGLAIGAAATIGREYFDRSVHDVHDIKGEFDVPVLGEVAHIEVA